MRSYRRISLKPKPEKRGIARKPWMGAALGLALLLGAGCTAGDKADRLVERARAQVAEMQPHPDFVPTPLTADTGQPGAVSPGGQLDSSSPAAAGVAPSGPNAAPSSATTGPTALATPHAGPQPAAKLDAKTLVVPAPDVATITDTPWPAPSATLQPTPTATPAYGPAQARADLTGLAHYWQNWNNCGPATLAMDLSYFGSRLGQNDISAALRPDKDDKNVNPGELVAYAQEQGFRAIARVNGEANLLRLLVSNGVPVIVETWMEPKPNDGMGHYRLVTGYDDATRQWTTFDSYESRGVDPNKPYAGMQFGYDELEPLWRVFDHTYVVVYTDKQAPAVEAILGADMDDQAMWTRAETAGRAVLEKSPDDAFAWFNLGTDLVGQGRYGEAAAAYDRARRLGLPWRMLWYQFGPFRAYYETARFKEVAALADATLKTTNNLEEVWYWRGMGLKGMDDVAGARQSWQRAMQLNRNYREPADALAALGQ
jgi:tetratricopeptide (TPR) repeat protein